jgi:uncharacterized protein (TIGR02265 family)
MSQPEGVIYSHAVKSFLEHVVVRRGLLDADLRRDLTALGLDLAKPRDVNLDTWVKALHLVAAKILPGATREAALEEVGREMFRGYVTSVVGRAMLLVLKLQGPRRSLLAIASNYSTADNVTKVATRELGPKEIELTFNQSGGVPTYVRGLILEAMATVGATGCRADFTTRPNGDEVFVVRWD